MLESDSLMYGSVSNDNLDLSELSVKPYFYDANMKYYINPD